MESKVGGQHTVLEWILLHADEHIRVAKPLYRIAHISHSAEGNLGVEGINDAGIEPLRACSAIGSVCVQHADLDSIGFWDNLQSNSSY